MAKKSNPKRVKYLVKQADDLIRTQPTTALKMMEKAEELAPEEIVVYDIKTRCLLTLRKIDEAEETIQRRLKIHEGSYGYELLAKVLFAKGDFNEAKKAIKKRLERKVDEHSLKLFIKILLAGGDLDKAREAVKNIKISDRMNVRIDQFTKYASNVLRSDPAKALVIIEMAQRIKPKNIAVLRIKIDCLLKLNKLDEAEHNARKCVKLDNRYRSYYLLADVLEAKGEFEQADKIETIIANRKLATDLLRQAKKIMASNPAKALAMLEKAIKLDPEKIIAEVNRTKCLLRLNRLDQAEEFAKKLIDLRGNYNDCNLLIDVLLAQNKLDEAREFAKNIEIPIKTYARFTQLTHQARTISEKDPAKALTIIEIAESIRSNHHRSSRIKVECLIKLGKVDQAEKIAREIVESHNMAISFATLAKVLFAKGELDEAEHNARKSIELGNRHYYSLLLADILKAKGEFKQAHDISTKIENERLATELSKIGTKLGKSNPEKALTMLEKAIKLDPEKIIAEVNRTKCLLRLNRLDKAEESARRCIELDESDKSYGLLTKVLLAKDELDMAEKTARKCIDLSNINSSNATIGYRLLATVLYSKYLYEEAEKAIRKAIELEDCVDHQRRLAEILRKMRQYDKALDILENMSEKNMHVELCKAYCYMGAEDFPKALEALNTAEKLIAEDSRFFIYNPRVRLYTGYIFLFEQVRRYFQKQNEDISDLHEYKWFEKVSQAANWLQTAAPSRIGPHQQTDFQNALNIIQKLDIK